MAGSRTAVNLTAAKSSGGTSAIPQSMTTKLKPQIVATRAARRESRVFTWVSLVARTVKDQRMVMRQIM